MPTAQKISLLKEFEKKHKILKKRFVKKHKKAQKWLEKRNYYLDDIRTHSARLLTGATLGSAVLLASPSIPLLNESSSVVRHAPSFSAFLDHLKNISVGSNISKHEENKIYQNFKHFFDIRTALELDGNRLPTYIGKMGLEQHLYRFSGDSLDQHTAFQEAGIASARGAFGYFDEKGKSPEVMVEQEQYYIVLQTFVIPEWNKDWKRLKKWYKFRKFLVVNPENGKAVVVVLGDSGPATWTDKVFGGSPEVMAGLGFYPKRTKGDVVILFIDDPENVVPLGPVVQKGF